MFLIANKDGYAIDECFDGAQAALLALPIIETNLFGLLNALSELAWSVAT
ncbi:MAG: hypothetical protein WB760_34525 [Xanthobacteraceae bacterium]